jgi:hypothetical protein
MAGLLPLIRTATGVGTTCLYPVTRRVTFSTGLKISLNANEQRAKTRGVLTEFSLNYSRVTATELATFRSFFESNQGPYGNWDFVLGRACLANVSGTSVTVTSSAYGGGPFRSTDTGSQIAVVGAGPSGGLLTTTLTYVDSFHATLGTPASTSVSNADTRWGLYYPNLMFMDQQFPATEEDATPLTYSFSLKIRQAPGQAFVSGAAGAAFPTLANGTTTQFPYIRTQRYSVLLTDNPHVGVRYSWTWWNGSLSGFPSSSLRGWQLHGPSLIDADLLTWENHFRANWGRYGTFSLTDPDDSTVHANCRYDLDQMEIQHLSPNVNSTVLRIMEFNNSASPI